MKTFQTLAKNLKLLFRSRETAFAIIFGPLLIILLVGFAFSGADDITVKLGVYSDDYTPLADEIIQSLNQKDFIVNIYSTQEECLNKVKDGENHMCIIFPPDFVVQENHTNMVDFNVDPSRINLVYAVIDELSTEFNIQSAAVSEQLTNEILSRVTATKSLMLEQSENAKKVQDLRTDAERKLSDSEGRVNTGAMNFTVMDFKLLRGRATGLSTDAQQIHDIAMEQLDEAIKVLHNTESKVDNASVESIEVAIDAFEDARIEIDGIYEETPDKLEDIYRQIDSASTAINSLEQNYGELEQDAAFVNEQLSSALADIKEMKRSVTEMKASMGFTHELFDSLEVSQAESIVSPIKTSISHVTREKDNLTFTYPYILMLVIMFMGLMLGSTLVVVDKTSNAAFRNFTTSTRDEFHILMSYLTTLIILLAQVLIILFFSYFLVSTPLLNNFGTSILILFISISLWSFIGMIIGYLSHNQESAMITGLTLGSISLFISNLVIPIEAMNSVIRAVTYINPYVVLSEMLKKSILFDIGVFGFGAQLALMIIVVIFLFISIIAIQRYMRKRYFAQMRAVEVKPVKKAVKPLEIQGRKVKDAFQLFTLLDMMTRAEFSQVVDSEMNVIYKWVRDELANKKLANKMKTTSKERMIIALDKHLRSVTRRQAKK